MEAPEPSWAAEPEMPPSRASGSPPASSILRLACVALMLRVETGAVPSMRPAFRLIAANPVMGAVLRPILATVRPRPRTVEKIAAHDEREETPS